MRNADGAALCVERCVRGLNVISTATLTSNLLGENIMDIDFKKPPRNR
jgi:hypothetical protein